MKYWNTLKYSFSISPNMGILSETQENGCFYWYISNLIHKTINLRITFLPVRVDSFTFSLKFCLFWFCIYLLKCVSFDRIWAYRNILKEPLLQTLIRSTVFNCWYPCCLTCCLHTLTLSLNLVLPTLVYPMCSSNLWISL